MVGGEQARNKELQQRHQQRKNLADQRKVHLIRALSENGEDSENVLLNVYNSIQEEVHAKNQVLVKVQGKVGQSVVLLKSLSTVELKSIHLISPNGPKIQSKSSAFM